MKFVFVQVEVLINSCRVVFILHVAPPINQYSVAESSFTFTCSRQLKEFAENRALDCSSSSCSYCININLFHF